jgi:hypothetical protein
MLGRPADDLPGVQADGLPGELMIFFDPPANDRDGDQPGQRDQPGVQHRQDDSVPV